MPIADSLILNGFDGNIFENVRTGCPLTVLTKFRLDAKYKFVGFEPPDPPTNGPVFVSLSVIIYGPLLSIVIIFGTPNGIGLNERS